jgi:cation:H+ antiporter
MGLLIPRTTPSFFLILLLAVPLAEAHSSTVFWAGPAILISAIAIAWAAESAQFFIAQGFALAILAWLQTLPEFAVEAVLAWHQQVQFLLANLTGALRLLTGFGWPVIYFTAAMYQRRRGGGPLKAICLEEHHAVEVMGLAAPLLYVGVIAWKGSLTVYDGAGLILLYAAYLLILSRMPPEDPETIEDLEAIPRKIVTSPRMLRIAIISGLFLFGGILIYVAAEPFLASLLALSVAVGIPAFVFIQWVAPVVSEFPEMASTFYWARSVDRAPMALMNMVSSNINQWTLLTAMLPIIFSISMGSVTPILFDQQQRIELLLTLGQAVVGMIFLMNMRLAWYEAAIMFVFFWIPFLDASWAKPVTVLYFAWAALEVGRMLAGRREMLAPGHFARIWRKHILRALPPP